MVIMDIRIDNFYAFKNFHMNMSYPKKIIDSTIEGEYLEDRPNFRYKKVNILMGGNATGKTSLGRMLMKFTNYCEDGEYGRFIKVINNVGKTAQLQIDFVTEKNSLFRFSMKILPKKGDAYKEDDVKIVTHATEIGSRDNYETCAKRLDESQKNVIDIRKMNTSGWFFAYPEDISQKKLYYSIENNPQYLQILEQIMQTLDPSIQKVVKVKEVENTYAIKLENTSVIVQDGKILGDDKLSSGTKAGLDISYIIASLFCDKHDLYYCDELFSFVNSDVEKACLSIIIEKLKNRKQLFFTTHNTEILDMQLPKHAFTFLKKDVKDEERNIRCVNAADFLKRNTDSLKHAVENDLFSTAPDLDKLYDILNMRCAGE